jgi:outer membrane protein
MKKTLILVLAIVILGVFAFSEVKIGIINAQDIIQKTKRGMRIQQKMDALQNQKAQELQALQDEIKKLETELQSPALNADAREKKTSEVQAKRTTLKRKYEDAQRDFQKESEKELAALEKELIPLIENLGKTKGFTIIFDRMRGGIVYSDSSVDITEEVVKTIDEKLK